MGLLTKQEEVMVLSPLPPDVKAGALLQALHDHYTILRLNDDILDKQKGIKLLEGGSAKTSTYHCDDSKQPGNGYDLSITNRSEGSDTETNAYLPLGQKMKINSSFRVVQQGYGWNLVEKVKIDGPRPVVAMAKTKIEGLHPKWHQKLFIRAAQLA